MVEPRSGSPQRTDGVASRGAVAALRSVLVLTVALGATVAISWLVVGGRAAFLGPFRVLEESGAIIYGVQAALAVAVGVVVGRRVEGAGRLGALVLGAWLGQLVALTIGGNLLANEIDPEFAWFYWWLGTGGPIQPVAALLGCLAGRWSARGPSRY